MLKSREHVVSDRFSELQTESKDVRVDITTVRGSQRRAWVEEFVTLK
jgi:hypothetical protein